MPAGISATGGRRSFWKPVKSGLAGYTEPNASSGEVKERRRREGERQDWLATKVVIYSAVTMKDIRHRTIFRPKTVTM